jgi:hypothetical protein
MRGAETMVYIYQALSIAINLAIAWMTFFILVATLTMLYLFFLQLKRPHAHHAEKAEVPTDKETIEA